MKKIDEFKKWLKEICWDFDKFFIIEEWTKNEERNDNGIKCKFYTNDHYYSIVAIDRDDEDGYLGCITSCRKPRAGEDWTRGNDLPDGKLTRETWENIKDGIIRYEIVKLSPKVEPQTDDCVIGESIE